MTKFLIASVAVLGMAGAAAAQEVPPSDFLINNISNAGKVQTVSPDRTFETSGIRSVIAVGAEGFQINSSENYSGK
jgi:hypothetical protein